MAVADPGFPPGWGGNPLGGRQHFAKFSQKLHEIERNLDPGGRSCKREETQLKVKYLTNLLFFCAVNFCELFLNISPGKIYCRKYYILLNISASQSGCHSNSHIRRSETKDPSLVE